MREWSAISYLAFLVCLVTCEMLDFPTDIIDNTIFLTKGHVYRLDKPLEWVGLNQLTIMGAGATVILGEGLENETAFTFRGSRWIWESIDITGGNVHSIFEMSTEGGFFQMRGCRINTSSSVDITLYGKMEVFIVQGNVLENHGTSPSFVSYSQNLGRMMWKNNRWKGNYTVYTRGMDDGSIAEANDWSSSSSVHTSVLNLGSFQSPDHWCYPPESHSMANETYVACTTSWFLRSLLNPNVSTVTLGLFSAEEEGRTLPVMAYFDRDVSIDLNGSTWLMQALEVKMNTTVKIKGMTEECLHEKTFIYVSHNATLELTDATLDGGKRQINVIAMTSHSHVFFTESSISDVEIISTGLGHLHVQDSQMTDFVLTAPNLWGSGNSFRSGKIVTQPYVGHMRDSMVRDTAYHISAFYLGEEPNYRMNFAKNTWKGESDLSISPSLTKKIQMDHDIIHTKKLSKKISFSKNIVARGVTDHSSRPLMISSPKGYIWPSGDSPERCPDGSHPGEHDDMGVAVRCIRCDRPERSKGGQCDNKRQVDMFDEDPLESSREEMRSSFSTPLSDTSSSFYGTRDDQVFSDCVTSASLCMGIDPDRINTTSFTLIQWMSVRQNEGYCKKSSLYCMDICRCESQCLTLGVTFFAIALSMGTVGVLYGAVVFFCLKGRKVEAKIRNPLGQHNCKNANPDGTSHAYTEGDNFCRICGLPVHPMSGKSRGFNTDILEKDPHHNMNSLNNSTHRESISTVDLSGQRYRQYR